MIRHTNGPIAEGVVRDALRSELTSRGFDVASDTLGLRGELYVVGDDDLARALFHFGTNAEDAADSIYRGSGSWADGMPPRFVVLPESESGSPVIELLEQIRTTPLFYSVSGGAVEFQDLDGALGAIAN